MRKRLYLVLGLMLLFSPGCIWKVPGYIRSFFALDLSKKDAKETPAQPKGDNPPPVPDEHGCCGDNEDTRYLVPCNIDGSSDPDGDHLCCYVCGKVCGKRPRFPGAKECPGKERHCRDLEDNGDGGFQCKHCKETCTISPDAKPPGPIPVPPKCGSHCERREPCKIGGGSCCANPNCHQACPPWSNADEE